MLRRVLRFSGARAFWIGLGVTVGMLGAATATQAQVVVTPPGGRPGAVVVSPPPGVRGVRTRGGNGSVVYASPPPSSQPRRMGARPVASFANRLTGRYENVRDEEGKADSVQAAGFPTQPPSGSLATWLMRLKASLGKIAFSQMSSSDLAAVQRLEQSRCSGNAEVKERGATLYCEVAFRQQLLVELSGR